MEPKDYEYLATDKVQCPKCGNLGELSLPVNTGYALEYAGVCGAQMETGVICDATLTLQVAAHVFPVQES